jgi:hypothetical protein
MSTEQPLREAIYNKYRYYRELNLSREKIIAELSRLGATAAEIAAVRQMLLQEGRVQKRKTGFALIATALILLVAGFIATAFLYHRGEPFQLVMYSSTGLGLALLLIGKSLVF